MKWIELDKKYVKVCSYASITVLLTLLIGVVGYQSRTILFTAWDLFAAICTPFVYGMLICYLLLPLVRKLCDWFEERGVFADNFRRRLNISVAVTMAAVIAILITFIFTLVFFITRSLDSVNFATVRKLWSNAEGDLMKLAQNILDMMSQFGFVQTNRTSSIFTTFGEVTGVFTRAIFSVIFAIYFLLDGRNVYNYAKRLFRAFFGDYTFPDLSMYLQDADAAFSGYIRGQFVDALVVGTTTALVFTIVGVPYGPVIGLLTGVGNLIPYVGGPVGFASTILVCLAEGNYSKLIVGCICLSIIMFIDSNVINPRLLSHTVEVHPLVVIMALIGGSAVGGLAGMLIAVPTAAFLKTELERWLDKRESEMDAMNIEQVGTLLADSSNGTASGLSNSVGEKA